MRCFVCWKAIPAADAFPGTCQEERRKFVVVRCRKCLHAQFPEKRCPQCGKTKPYHYFSKCVTFTLGLSSYCRACMRQYKITRPLPRRVNPGPDKWCPKCKRTLPVGQFWRYSWTADRRNPVCKSCYEQHYRKRPQAQKEGTVKRRQAGQGLVEYSLILALVVILVVAILVLMAPAIGQMFSSLTGGL